MPAPAFTADLFQISESLGREGITPNQVSKNHPMPFERVVGDVDLSVVGDDRPAEQLCVVNPRTQFGDVMQNPFKADDGFVAPGASLEEGF